MIQLLGECEGAVILGYPQVTVSIGLIKDNDIKDTILLATEWNHIEAGLAYALGLPLLVIHHLGIKRGIFDRGTINNFIYEKDLSLGNWSLLPDMQGALVNWKKKCIQPSESLIKGKSEIQAESPVCPNCSSVNKLFYLSPILMIL